MTFSGRRSFFSQNILNNVVPNLTWTFVFVVCKFFSSPAYWNNFHLSSFDSIQSISKFCNWEVFLQNAMVFISAKECSFLYVLKVQYAIVINFHENINLRIIIYTHSTELPCWFAHEINLLCITHHTPPFNDINFRVYQNINMQRWTCYFKPFYIIKKIDKLYERSIKSIAIHEKIAQRLFWKKKG